MPVRPYLLSPARTLREACQEANRESQGEDAPIARWPVSASGNAAEPKINGSANLVREEDEMETWWHEQRVRERAYAIWKDAGCPDGKSVEHWLQAEAEIAAEERGLEQEIALESEGVV